MPMSKLTLHVALATPDGGEVEHAIEVRHVDKLECEVKGAAMGVPAMTDAPLTGITFWAWAALKREGIYAGSWNEFRNHDCLNVEPDEETPELDPTRPGAPTPSPSP